MARIVILKDKKPFELKTNNETYLICRCGLTKSSNGLCDDSCAKTHDEDDSKTYMYMDEGREEVDLVSDFGDEDMDMFGHGCCGGHGGSCGCGSHSHDSKDEDHGCGCHGHPDHTKTDNAE